MGSQRVGHDCATRLTYFETESGVATANRARCEVLGSQGESRAHTPVQKSPGSGGTAWGEGSNRVRCPGGKELWEERVKSS